jgi:hypothetical protein
MGDVVGVGKGRSRSGSSRIPPWRHVLNQYKFNSESCQGNLHKALQAFEPEKNCVPENITWDMLKVKEGDMFEVVRSFNGWLEITMFETGKQGFVPEWVTQPSEESDAFPCFDSGTPSANQRPGGSGSGSAGVHLTDARSSTCSGSGRGSGCLSDRRPRPPGDNAEEQSAAREASSVFCQRNRHKALQAFDPDQNCAPENIRSDMLKVKERDMLEVVRSSNGWVKITMCETGKQGWVPAWVLQRSAESDYSLCSDFDSSDSTATALETAKKRRDGSGSGSAGVHLTDARSSTCSGSGRGSGGVSDRRPRPPRDNAETQMPHKALQAFDPDKNCQPENIRSDMLTVKEGDMLQLVSSGNGWVKIRMCETGKKGWVPEWVLQSSEESDASPCLNYDSRDSTTTALETAKKRRGGSGSAGVHLTDARSSTYIGSGRGSGGVPDKRPRPPRDNAEEQSREALSLFCHGTRHKALQAFDPDKNCELQNIRSDMLKVKEGDMLEVVRSGNGWVEITMCQTGQQGWVPEWVLPRSEESYSYYSSEESDSSDSTATALETAKKRRIDSGSSEAKKRRSGSGSGSVGVHLTAAKSLTRDGCGSGGVNVAAAKSSSRRGGGSGSGSGAVTLTAAVSSTGGSIQHDAAAFELLKNARAAAGVRLDGKTLEEKEMGVAHKWLVNTFKSDFIENVDLRDRIRNASDNSNLSRQQKAKLKTDTRGAFKVWTKSLFGNHAFFMAVLRNGLFDIQSQQELMNAILQEQSNSGDDSPAGRDKQKLRRKALEAREKHRKARKVANAGIPESEMSKKQIRMLWELNSGLLDQNRSEADTTYRHGQGIKIRTKEEAACLRITANHLDAYFGR